MTSDQRRLAWMEVSSALERALDPGALLEAVIRRRGSQLTVIGRGGESMREIELDSHGDLVLLAVGKGVVRAARVLAELFAGQRLRGCVVTKGAEVSPAVGLGKAETRRQSQECVEEDDLAVLEGLGLECIFAGHPLPNQASRRAALLFEERLADVSEHDLVIVVLAGGASSLLCGITDDQSFARFRQISSLLMERGADIVDLNTVRAALDPIKAGGLRKLASQAQLLTLVISDVPPHKEQWVGSGPTFDMDRPTLQDVREALRRSHCEAWLDPASSGEVVLRQEERDATTMYPDGPRASVHLVASNDDALAVLDARLGANGDLVIRAKGRASGFVGQHAGALHSALIAIRRSHDRSGLSSEPTDPNDSATFAAASATARRVHVHLLAGGELTTQRRESAGGSRPRGIGGRLCELALCVASLIDGDLDASFLALASDGDDGNSGLCGAGVDGTSWARATQLGLDPKSALANGDAGTVLVAIGAALKASRERVNVNDVWALSFTLPAGAHGQAENISRLLRTALDPDMLGAASA